MCMLQFLNKRQVSLCCVQIFKLISLNTDYIFAALYAVIDDHLELLWVWATRFKRCVYSHLGHVKRMCTQYKLNFPGDNLLSF